MSKARNIYQSNQCTTFAKIQMEKGRQYGKMKATSSGRERVFGIIKDTIIGDADYFMALKNIEKYALDSKEDNILVKGLSLSELESLAGL